MEPARLPLAGVAVGGVGRRSTRIARVTWHHEGIVGEHHIPYPKGRRRSQVAPDQDEGQRGGRAVGDGGEVHLDGEQGGVALVHHHPRTGQQRAVLLQREEGGRVVAPWVDQGAAKGIHEVDLEGICKAEGHVVEAGIDPDLEAQVLLSAVGEEGLVGPREQGIPFLEDEPTSVDVGAPSDADDTHRGDRPAAQIDEVAVHERGRSRGPWKQQPDGTEQQRTRAHERHSPPRRPVV